MNSKGVMYTTIETDILIQTQSFWIKVKAFCCYFCVALRVDISVLLSLLTPAPFFVVSDLSSRLVELCVCLLRYNIKLLILCVGLCSQSCSFPFDVCSSRCIECSRNMTT